MADILIIGNGPAGISAALYAVRAGMETVIIGRDGGALAKAEKIENYYGLSAPVKGEELIKNGIKQAKSVGAKVVGDEVVSISSSKKLTVKTKQGEYEGDAVIIATGASRATPEISGIKEFEGRGISYCAVCDGFFHRGKRVAVLGAGEYALSEARELLPLAAEVALITNGEEITADFPENVKIIKTKIKAFEGSERLERVVFVDGGSIEVSGVFVAVGVAGSGDLAKKIGAETDGRRIVVKQDMSTGVPGLFAAGDCTGGMLQVAKAVYEGAMAGTEAVKYLKKLKAKKEDSKTGVKKK